MSEGRFALVSPHLPASEVQVASFTGTEAVNDVYAFDVTCHATLPVDAMSALERRLPGSRASLSIGEREVHGVVTEVAFTRSLSRGAVAVQVRLEPRLALLGLNRNSVIHQDMTVPEVARQLLESWAIPVEERFEGDFRKRTYLTQYQETDLAFLKRILASVGVFFFFEHPSLVNPLDPARERVVLCDTAALYSSVAGERHLRFAEETNALGDASGFDHVTRFGRIHRLRPHRALLGDYDFRNPGLPQLAGAEAPDVPDVSSEPAQLRSFEHHVDAEIESTSGSADLDARSARSALEQHRVDALVAEGVSYSHRLQVGATFALEGHPVDHVNAGYAVTRVEHRGRVPELAAGADGPVYQNRFECVPEHIPARPQRHSVRRRQVAETAMVVGEGEDIHTDDLGRIKVKFHWDMSGRDDASASCWLRVAQSWAGAHFGAQFIPRVGDEVIVTFLGGDADRPIVTGSVYNGTHPTPFDLPDNKDTSGFRTQTTPGGSGYNELSFCDRAGEERIYVRAERDLVEEVQRDHKLEVAHDQTLAVVGAQLFSVGSGQTMKIGGEQIVSVEGNQQMTATGSGVLAYGGDTDFQVGRQLTTRVDGRERREIRDQSNALYRDDCVTKVLGHHTTIVGEHDARRAFTVHVEGSTTSYASGTMRMESDKDIELRVGESVLRITEEGIEMTGKSLRINGDALELRAEDTLAIEAPTQVTMKSNKVLMESESAFLGLAKVAKLKGELVKLNCDDDPIDALDPPEAPKLTTIVLNDEEGNAIANQRFVLVLPDGTEKTGTLNEQGQAEIEVAASGEIIFPDVHDPRPA